MRPRSTAFPTDDCQTENQTCPNRNFRIDRLVPAIVPQEDIIPKKTRYEMEEYPMDQVNTAGIGLAIGVGLGLIFGIMFNQVGLGIALGAAFGLTFGFTIPGKEKTEPKIIQK